MKHVTEDASTMDVDDSETGTRVRVLSLIVELGPITAADLADQLQLTSAAVRRHLAALEDDGRIRVQEEIQGAKRGRGRPAKRYVAAPESHPGLGNEYADAALSALHQLRQALGPGAITGFASQRARELREKYSAALDQAGDDLKARARALSRALSEDGYAATLRPMPGGVAVQLCQGHCPVLQIAKEHPELCEEETRLFSDLLGVHVQRLATLAGGEHVCTTHIPVKIPTFKDA